MTEDSVSTMESLFERVENLGAWDSYIRSFQTIGVTDEELSMAMIDATFNSNDELLYRLTTSTKSGRRVFKQLCLKGRMSFFAYFHMQERDESDLALNVVVGLGKWDFVPELYEHVSVTQRSRRQAFRCAIRAGAWDAVTQMAACSVTCRRDRREAFLAAVRQGQFTRAVQLYCGQDVGVTDVRDLRFAIKTCFATGQCKSAAEFLHCCRSDEERYQVLKIILKEAIHAGNVVLLRNSPIYNRLYLEGSSVVETADGAGCFDVNVQENPLLSTHSSLLRIEENHLVNAVVTEIPAAADYTSTDDTMDLLQSMDDTDGHQRLLRYLLRQAVGGNNAECFKSLCLQSTRWEETAWYAFKRAFEGGRTHLVTHVLAAEFCHSFRHDCLLGLAVKLAVRAGKWEFIEDTADIHKLCFPWLEHFVVKTDLLKGSKNWPFLIPIVEQFIKSDDSTGDLAYIAETEIGNQFSSSRKTKRLAKWCEENSFPHFALYLSVATGDWLAAKRITDSMKNPMCFSLYDMVLEKSLAEGAWNVAAACLKHAPTDGDDDVIGRFHWMMDLTSLIKQCREDGMKDWVVKLAVWTGEWEIVETEIESCDDQSVLNFTLKEAAESNQWHIVKTLLTRCSGSEPCLRDVLTSAIVTGECAIVKTLLNMINPLSDAFGYRRSILCTAVQSYENREEMVLLCIKAGVSTHQQADDSFMTPMENALNWLYSPPPLSTIKALFESGACSYNELRRLMNNTYIKMRLETRIQTKILQFMEEAARTPRSLQNLCRLSVSHLIGCWPGRENRILSLPVPQCVKDFLMFTDLASDAMSSS